ncbi:MAG: pilus assembly protein PilM, partial [Candidatus Paceibacterota bacterium]
MKFNFAKKIFCTPNYLSMPAIGISISNHAIRYIDFCNKKDKISLKKYGEVLFPSGIVKDGEILNKEALIKIISELKNELSSNIINVSIPEDKSYIFNIKVPKVSEKEIRQILEFKIEENVPLKVDESIFEYEIVKDFFDEKELLLNVSVIPKSTIIEYTEVFNLAGFYPVSFETESGMVAYSTVPINDKKTFMIINVKD